MPDDTAKTHVFLKAIVFLALFLGLYTTTLALIPSEFYYAATASGSTFDFSFLSLEDVRKIRFLEQVNITRSAFAQGWFDFTPDASYKMRVIWDGSLNLIWFEHLTWEFLIFQQFDQMQIENIPVGDIELLEHSWLTKNYTISKWNPKYNASILDPVECPHVRTKVWIIDQNSTRNNIGSAWDEGKLTISMGFGYDDMFAKQSSLDILGRILLFQAPTIFGLTGDMATIVNLILTVPFYAMVGVLIMLIIIAFIPF